MRVLGGNEAPDTEVIADHVALPVHRSLARGFVRLNMISSADGGTAIDGVSGNLGNRSDHAVFAALRANADAVLVGLSTVVIEGYHPPNETGPQIFVVSPTPDVSGNPELFASGRATFVVPEGAPPAPPGVPALHAGTGGRVDLGAIVAGLVDKVILLEGGPRLAGAMLGLGLVDEFFHTTSPMLIGGESARVAHGPLADAEPWGLLHGFCDDAGYLFLRYAKTCEQPESGIKLGAPLDE
ncbi:MAG: dihydrofolate reductase family protein [Acidimicrobiia bacterium]